jgi:hypothetical protein
VDGEGRWCSIAVTIDECQFVHVPIRSNTKALQLGKGFELDAIMAR